MGLTALPPSCADLMKSGNFNFPEPSGPLQACNGTARCVSGQRHAPSALLRQDERVQPRNCHSIKCSIRRRPPLPRTVVSFTAYAASSSSRMCIVLERQLEIEFYSSNDAD